MVTVRSVEVTPVAFADPPLLNAAGVHEPWALRTILQVRTDEGLVGLGETYGDETVLDLVRRAAPNLAGLSVFDLNGLRERVVRALAAADDVEAAASPMAGLTGGTSLRKSVASIIAAFEVALFDLQGKATGQPVSALLGGKVRDTVPFAAYLFYKWAAHADREPDTWGAAMDPEGVVAQAKLMVDRFGFQSLKLKGGVFPPDAEMDAIRALHDAFPNHPLRLDPNAAWTVPTSQRVAREMDGYLEYLEDPTPDRPGMAEVAAVASMPLATNMCVVEFDHIPEGVRLGSVGVILGDHHYWGGLDASSRLATICETFGIGMSMHSNTHLGISLAAMAHLAAATPQLSYACDTHTPWTQDDVVSNPLSFRDGAVRVPDTPGLGVELDPDALARLHEQYVQCGIVKRGDESYRQRFEPDFVRRRAYW